MRRLVVFAAFLSSLFLSSCTSKTTESAGERPHATVSLRDGSQLSGALVANSNKEIKILGDDNVTHTIPTSQVKSIDYADTPTSTAMPETQTPPREQATAPAAPARRADRGPAPAAPPSRPAQTQPPPVHAELPHPPESAITTKTFELPVGTEIAVRTEDTIDSSKAVEGQTYAAEVVNDVLDAAGATVIPRGANAEIIIRSVSQGGRIRGASDLVLDLQSISIDGREYQLSTSDVTERGKSGIGANRRTAEHVGGGAAVGAIIGAIAGGKKGAAIGAGAGAGAGAVAQILTKGGSIRVPVETILTFKLDRPLKVLAARR
ncbi:MAG: hypothetical protein HYX72_08180 [Acidobacteria bacterium]|nr:hypothetical protein [Acidobacteriota bacterium]